MKSGEHVGGGEKEPSCPARQHPARHFKLLHHAAKRRGSRFRGPENEFHMRLHVRTSALCCRLIPAFDGCRVAAASAGEAAAIRKAACRRWRPHAPLGINEAGRWRQGFNAAPQTRLRLPLWRWLIHFHPNKLLPPKAAIQARACPPSAQPGSAPVC